MRLRAALTAITLLLLPVSLPASPASATDWAWRFIAGGATVGSGAIGAGSTYYFAAEDRFLYAVEPSGRMIWRTDLGRRAAGRVVTGPDQSIYVALENGEIVALNRDGRLLWRRQPAGGSRFWPVVTATGMIVVAGPSGVLVAYTHTGREVWRATLGADLVTSPVLGFDGNVIVATSDGYVRRVSTDGRLVDAQFIGEVGSVVVPGSSRVYVGSSAGRVVALSASLEPLWRVDVGSAIVEMVTTAGDALWLCTDDATIVRVGADGRVLWRETRQSQIIGIVAPGSGGAGLGDTGSAPGAVLVVDRSGRLGVIGPDGSLGWEIRLPDRPTTVVLSSNDTAVVATANWITVAYALGARAPSGGSAEAPGADALAAWPQARGGPERGGAAQNAPAGRSVDRAWQGTEYLLLRSLLSRPDASGQMVAMADIRDRVESGASLDGRYRSMLELLEYAAGSPYFGPQGQFGSTLAVSRRAREIAVSVLAQIGDLESVQFLVRLLDRETDAAMQATILTAIADLGGDLDDTLARRLMDIVRRDVARGASDSVARTVMEVIERLDAYRGRYVSPEIGEILLLVSQSGYGRSVRQSALELLRLLAGGR